MRPAVVPDNRRAKAKNVRSSWPAMRLVSCLAATNSAPCVTEGGQTVFGFRPERLHIFKDHVWQWAAERSCSSQQENNARSLLGRGRYDTSSGAACLILDALPLRDIKERQTRCEMVCTSRSIEVSVQGVGCSVMCVSQSVVNVKPLPDETV